MQIILVPYELVHTYISNNKILVNKEYYPIHTIEAKDTYLRVTYRIN